MLLIHLESENYKHQPTIASLALGILSGTLRVIEYSMQITIEAKGMFTGIIQGTAPVVAIDEKPNFRTHVVKFPQALLAGLATGASVAHNGCCLTVTGIDGDLVSFDLMKETLRLTNLGEIKLGERVNLERAAKFGDEIGGHLMSGHIVSTAEVVKILASENNRQIWFALPTSDLMKYILHKGFIGIDGISLTVGEVSKNRFCIHLIPETLQRTTLGTKRLGDKVNIELDSQTQSIVDTVERVLQHGENSALFSEHRTSHHARVER